MTSSFDFARQRCAIIGQANAALNYARIDREDFDRGRDIRRISAKSNHSMEQLDRNFPTFFPLVFHLISLYASPLFTTLPHRLISLNLKFVRPLPSNYVVNFSNLTKN